MQDFKAGNYNEQKNGKDKKKKIMKEIKNRKIFIKID